MSSKLIVLIGSIQFLVALSSIIKGDKATSIIFIGFTISNIGFLMNIK